MTFSIINTRNLVAASAVALMLATPLAFTQAADFGYDTIDTFYPMDMGGGSMDYGGGYADVYDIYEYDYGGGYGGGYGGYSPSYGIPASFGGGSWGGFGGAPSNTTVVSPTTVTQTTNTCTGGNNCNVYMDDHSVVNIPTNFAAPATPTYTVPTYTPPPIYSYPTYHQPIYQPYMQPIAYSNPAPQPYVTLSSVPYTGLELGPVGTFLYWSFLILWCLAAAYFIAVKKVQNKVFASLSNFFYPEVAPQVAASAPASATHAPVTKASTPVFSGIDTFIQSQINRARA